MRNRFRTSTTTLLIIAGLAGIGATPAVVAAQSAATPRVTVPSRENFGQTVGQLKAAVSHGGMMVMAEVNQGKMLTMTGLNLNATLFLVGNPTVGKQILGRDPAAGLYLPLRVYVYEANGGHTYVSYDRPSALLAQLGNADVSRTAGMLDQKLDALAHMAAR